MNWNLFDRYLASHPAEAEMMRTGPMPASPRLMMMLVGPVIGVVSGVVIGLLAVVVRKILGSRRAPTPSTH